MGKSIIIPGSVNILKTYNTRYPLECMKMIMRDIRDSNTALTLYLKSHYSSGNILGIIESDTTVETIDYNETTNCIRYVNTDLHYYNYIDRYISVKNVFRGPLSTYETDTLSYYGYIVNDSF